MPRSKRCCCRTPGVQRIYGSTLSGGGLFINPDDLRDGKCLNSWPCWATPFAGVLTYDGCSVAGRAQVTPPGADVSVIGYNHAQHALLFATGGTSFEVPYTLLGIDPDYPGIISAKIDSCQVVTLGGSIFETGGYLPYDSLITSEESYDLQTESTDGATLAGSPNSYSSWIGCTDERIFALTRYFSGSDFSGQGHFVVWSVDYDGSDYAVVYDISRPSVDLPVLPTTANVANGIAYHVSFPGGGASFELFENGGSLGTMTDGTSENGAAASVAGQTLFLQLTGGLTIMHSGGSVPDYAVQFVVLNDAEEEVTYYPVSIAYDKTHESVVVFWGFFSAFGFFSFVPYVTYIKGEITPGNIVGQGNVDIYGLFPAASCGEIGTIAGGGSGFGGAEDIGAATGQACVIIEGHLPRPLTVTAGHIGDPEPPEPDCDDFLTCSDETQAFFKLFGDGLAARDEDQGSVSDLDGVSGLTSLRHWQDMLFNAVLLDVAFLPGGVIPDDGGRPAAGLDGGSGSMKRYWLPFGTYGSFDDPGFMVYDDDYSVSGVPDSTFHNRGYFCGVVVEVTCSSGQGIVTAVRFEIQNFKGRVGATDPDLEWDSGLLPFEHYLATPFEQIGDPVDYYLLYGIPTACAMSGILTKWWYSNLLSSGPSGTDFQCFSYCIIGLL